MKIYVFFGELGFLNRWILGKLENYNNITILTNEDYGLILKTHLKDKIKLALPKNNIYVEYRRFFNGNPGCGNPDNFKIINSVCNIALDSNLIKFNSWLQNSNFFNKWIKEENIDSSIFNNLNESIYEFICKKYPNKPWEKYKDNSNILYDLNKDLLKIPGRIRNNEIIIRSPLLIKPKQNNYIHIFPKKKPRHDKQFIELSYFIDICKFIKSNYNYKIFCHGNIESMSDELNKYVDFKSTSLEESINYFYNSLLLISPFSGMAELALNCKIKNVFYITNKKKLINKFRPFNNNIKGVHKKIFINELKLFLNKHKK